MMNETHGLNNNIAQRNRYRATNSNTSKFHAASNARLSRYCSFTSALYHVSLPILRFLLSFSFIRVSTGDEQTPESRIGVQARKLEKKCRTIKREEKKKRTLTRASYVWEGVVRVERKKEIAETKRRRMKDRREKKEGTERERRRKKNVEGISRLSEKERNNEDIPPQFSTQKYSARSRELGGGGRARRGDKALQCGAVDTTPTSVTFPPSPTNGPFSDPSSP